MRSENELFQGPMKLSQKLLMGVSQKPGAPQGGKPVETKLSDSGKDILLITADQFRHDALGCRGIFPIQTPNLDALAAGGTVFEQAYPPYPMCVPARASIMTGLHSFRDGVYSNDLGWPEECQTLPAVLAENGSSTIEVGKTHFIPKRRHGGFQKIILSEDDEPTYFTTRARGELEKLVQQRDYPGDAEELFFLWLSVLPPHSPCASPPPYDKMYRPEDMPLPVKSKEEKNILPSRPDNSREVERVLSYRVPAEIFPMKMLASFKEAPLVSPKKK